MSDQQQVWPVLDQLNKELGAILKQTLEDLNTVAGKERLEKWRLATLAVLKQQAGERIAKQFELTRPSPSFTHDLVEEFEEEVDTYRTALDRAVKALRARAGGGATS